MIFRPVLLAVLVMALIGFTYPVRAQTTENTQAAEPNVLATSFSLIVLGTRHHSDVDVIISNLKNLPYIERIVPSLTSQLRQEFEGSFLHNDGDIIADVRSLAANRFELEDRLDHQSRLIITLRKIGTPKALP